MIWLNNQLVADCLPHIPATDRGLLLAEGVFDTLLVIDGVANDWDLHLSRLFASAAYFDIDTPFTASELQAGLVALVESDGERPSRAVLRITATRGAGGRGLVLSKPCQPNWIMQLSPLSPPPTTMTLAGVECRRNESSPLCRHKTTNYLEAIVARRMALAAGAEEALMCNTRGQVAAVAVGNIFIQREGCLLTPPISAGALPGIIRGKIVAQRTIAGLPVIETDVEMAELMSSSAVFVSNSLIGLVPVIAIDGQSLPISPEYSAMLTALTAIPL